MNIDLTEVMDILNDAMNECLELDQRLVTRDDGKRSHDHAQINRDLLRLSDRLQLAAGIVKDEYWRIK